MNTEEAYEKLKKIMPNITQEQSAIMIKLLVASYWAGHKEGHKEGHLEASTEDMTTITFSE